ncbi:MAG TPA: OmpH family outer membrane protein [Vicinamibacterales bacterium]|nr:OmpH family outer membrane protein [Vicinamibacterales bacterium]
MRPLKLMIVTAAAAFTMAAIPGFAQTTPAPQTPPAQTPAKPAPQAPATPPQAAPQPPRPFPQGAKIAYVDLQEIASSSAAGKEASKKLKDLNDKKVGEIGEKNKQLTTLQSKLNTGGTVLSDAARDQLTKDIDKLQRDIQFSQQSAQAELNDMQNELQADFQKKLMPIIEQVATEKGLLAVFSIRDAGIAWAEPGLDISQDVIKRLDGAAPGTPKQ